MAKVVQTDVAREEIRELVRRLWGLNRVAAKKLAESLTTRFRQLETSPKLGRERPDFGEGIRSLVVGSYIAIYHATDQVVTILRVVHGARDLKAI